MSHSCSCHPPGKQKSETIGRFRYWLSETLTLLYGKATTFGSRFDASVCLGRSVQLSVVMIEDIV